MNSEAIQNIFDYQESARRISRNLYTCFLMLYAIHTVIVGIFFLLKYLLGDDFLKKAVPGVTARIVRVTTENINEDKKRNLKKISRLSKEDSSGKGRITKKKGENVLSRFFEFQKPQIAQNFKPAGIYSEKDNRGKKGRMEDKVITSEKGMVTLSFIKPSSEKNKFIYKNRFHRVNKRFKIPEHYRFQKKFALNISNDRRNFSFNTIKYPDYKYFQEMKKKIQRNWFRNAPPGGMFLGNLDQYYYPGLSRVVSFKPGNSLIVFAINRQGKIQDIKILKRHPSGIITESCFKAIEDSREFGPLPESIKEDFLVIPMNFIYSIY